MTQVLFDRLKSDLAQCINDGTIYFVKDSNGNFTQLALGDGSKSHVVGIGPKMDDATKQELMSKLGLTISSDMGTIQLGKLANHNGVSSQKVVTYERTGLGTDTHEISNVGYVQQYLKTAKAMVYAGVFNAQTKEITDYNTAIISPSEEGNVTFDYLLNGNEGETLLTPGMSFIVGTAGDLEGYTGISVYGGETKVEVGDMIIITDVTQKESEEGGSTYNEASILIMHNKSLDITEFESGIIYDVSAHNNVAVFENLQTLLSSSNLDTLIPTAVRHGGMTIRFIQSSDNKYMQYRLMNNQWSTKVTDWQGVDDKPTAGSENLVKSSSVRDLVVRITGIGNSGQESGATNIGDIFFHTGQNKLKRVISIEPYHTVDEQLIKGAIYTIENTNIAYVFNGTDVVPIKVLNDYDDIPTSGSNKAVKSNGIYNSIKDTDYYHVRIVGIGEGAAAVGATEGDFFFHSLQKKLKQVVNGSSVERPTYEGAIYILKSTNIEYTFDGTDVVPVGCGDTDNIPTENSTKPIQSGGVYTAINDVNYKISEIVGIGSSGSEAGATEVGDRFFHTGNKLLKEVIQISPYLTKELPTYENSIYVIKNTNIAYLWDGTNIKPIKSDVSLNLLYYLPDYHAEATDEYIGKIAQIANNDDLVLSFITDLHIGKTFNEKVGSLHGLMSVNEVASTGFVDVLINGGDIANTVENPTEENPQMSTSDFWRAIGYCKYIPKNATNNVILRGNHEVESLISKSKFFQISGISKVDNIIRNNADADGSYGYIDYEDKKVRLILLDTSTITYLGGSGDKQLVWLKNTAFDFSNKTDYSAVIISHISLNEIPSSDYRNLFSAFHSGSSATIAGEIVDFSQQGAIPMVYIAGHTHADSNNTTYGFLTITTIDCSTTREPNHLNNIGSVNECSYDTYIINSKNKTVTIKRYGYGNDRSFTFD